MSIALFNDSEKSAQFRHRRFAGSKKHVVQRQGFGAYLKAQDAFVELLNRSVPELKGVGLSRQRAMVANYPSAGARYARHVDNPDQNGRKLTVILYLNPGSLCLTIWIV